MAILEYDKNVFINCPFDKEYQELLFSAIFTILYLDFNPRIALESSDSGTLRLNKILQLIRESRLSIHDISRIQSKSADEYYRLNMPFELGLDYSSKIFDPSLKKKLLLILETKPHAYRKAISDINGLDIKNHNDDPQTMVGCIRNWFVETVGLRGIDGSLKVWQKYNDFNIYLLENIFQKYFSENDEFTSERMAKSDIEEMPVPEYIDEIKNWLEKYR